jgi:hypothetical protein
VTPETMLRMSDLRVATEQLCFEPPNHILILRYNPFLFLVACFIICISTGMCVKLLVISPLGPFTLTYLVFTVRVTTKAHDEFGDIAYLLREYEPIPQLKWSSFSLISSCILNNNNNHLNLFKFPIIVY